MVQLLVPRCEVVCVQCSSAVLIVTKSTPHIHLHEIGLTGDVIHFTTNREFVFLHTAFWPNYILVTLPLPMSVLRIIAAFRFDLGLAVAIQLCIRFSFVSILPLHLLLLPAPGHISQLPLEVVFIGLCIQ